MFGLVRSLVAQKQGKIKICFAAMFDLVCSLMAQKQSNKQICGNFWFGALAGDAATGKIKLFRGNVCFGALAQRRCSQAGCISAVL
jgi:hypothetical protein